MYKIAVMGDKDSIYGFAALGIEIFPVTEAIQATEELRKMANKDYAVIYITESLAAIIPEEINKYKNRSVPAVILIPGITGNTGMGLSNLKRTVEKAVGSDILN